MKKEEKIVNFYWTNREVKLILKYPHLLGHFVGFDKLNKLHSDWILKMFRNTEKGNDYSLQGHRQSYKTTTIAVGIVLWLLLNPNSRIAIIRKTFSEACKVVKTVSLIFEDKIIQSLFLYTMGVKPKKIIDRQGQLLFNFKTTITQELSVEAHGLEYSITGTHYDKIICDDIITLKDRISRAERERTKEVLKELRTNVIERNKGICLIGTPWHKSDAWQLVNDIDKYDIYKTDLLTEKEIEDIKKKTTPSLFSINYLLKEEADEDLLFKNPKYGKWQGGTENYLHLDTAFDGEHYNALSLVGKISDNEFQVKGWVYSGNVKDWLNFIKQIYFNYKCKLIYVEDNADKGYTSDKLRELGLRVKGYTEHMNKHLKISTVLYSFWSKLIFDENIDENYMEQILDYREKQEPDDAPDSLASLLKFIRNKPFTNVSSIIDVGVGINV